MLNLAADRLYTDAPHSVFCQHTINVGPATVCSWHTDSENLAPGICGIGVLGNFDHCLAGHVLLREARVILEVAPGDRYYLPSALITHRNSRLREGETCYSFVLYSPASVFRHYFYKLNPTEASKKKCPKEGRKQWMAGVSLFPTFF